MKILYPVVRSPPAAMEINGGKRQEMEDKSTQSRNTKGKDEQINNTTLQLTGTFHQGTSMHFTNNTYFPVTKRQGDKWQAQRSQRKCVMILRIKSNLVPQSLVQWAPPSKLPSVSHSGSFNHLQGYLCKRPDPCSSNTEHRIPKTIWKL